MEFAAGDDISDFTPTGEARPVATMAAVIPSQRDLRLDLFRGIALWLIFIDHIPHNVASWITIRNYGFSDAAEIFVFISGYTAAFVYGRAMRMQGFLIAGIRILRRVSQIYVAHIFLCVVLIAHIAHVARNFENPLFVEEMNVLEFLRQPDVTLFQAMLLKFRPVNMDILPVYIVLLLGFPPVLWLLLRVPNLTLVASVALYGLAWWFGWYLESYPSGYWVINPLHWQLLFVFGAWCAVFGAERFARAVRSPVSAVVAGLYLAFALYVVFTWYFPSLARHMPHVVGNYIYPIDKTNLDLLRVAHFLALAILTVQIVPRDWPGLKSRLLRPAILCGQHSLPIFCLGIFLSLIGHFILVEVSGRVAMQILVSAVGICILVAAAALLDWYKRIEAEDPRRHQAQTAQA